MPNLKRLSVTRQFTLLGIIGVLITVIAIVCSLMGTYEVALRQKKAEVKGIVDAGVSLTEAYVRAAASGAMSVPQAQREAKLALSAIRYDHGDYVFVETYDGTVIVHIRKNFIGTNRYNATDPYGTRADALRIDAARAGHPIFVRYYFPKPGVSTPQPKISYAAAVPEWGWVIGSGLYIDDLQTAVLHSLLNTAFFIIPLFLLFILVIFLMRRGVSQLMSGLTRSMERIAHGDFDSVTPGLDRADELGRMAKTLNIFRDAALEKTRLEQEAQNARAAAAEERTRAEADRADRAREQGMAVAAIAGGLEQLSAGDLLFRIGQPFSDDYEKLRQDFNSAVDTLQETMRSITATTEGVRSGAGEIAQAANDLSRRTEQQAAGLEQTAAALDGITMAVRKSAEGAQEASHLVSRTKTDAEESGRVVRDAIGAMDGIDKSSREIGSIVTLIDEIAFQTNLLALNAGVEAARAGDAGRGFAVVATEVRALAQRSADAAREIKTLISTADQQVRTGVKLVDETGVALARIVDHVTQLNQLVSGIASSAREQATGLSEVNSAVTQMDQVTQQNAAMVEQATAASHGMMQEAETLNGLIAQFRIGRALADKDEASAKRRPVAGRPSGGQDWAEA